MKQVVQEISTGNTVVLEVPVPTAQPGMAVVKTAASLVSVGTERALVEFAGKDHFQVGTEDGRHLPMLGLGRPGHGNARQ